MKKLSIKEWVAVAVGVLFITYMFFGDSITGIFTGTNNANVTTNNMDNQANADNNQNSQNSNTAAVSNSTNPVNTVQAEDIVVGKGTEVQKGMQVGVNYVLKLADGTVIQNSKDVNGGKPFIFTAGAGQLIPGWEMGILGMKVGGKRLLTIPPELGYGAQAAGPIPANSTLVFEIEVVSASATPTQ